MSEETKDLERARQSLIEELQAINWYQERIEEKFYRDLAEKSEYKNILLYLADVEKGHHTILEAEHNMVMQYPDYYNKSWDTDMIHLEP